jgi:ketosteroid isomerase-like protein
MTRVTILSLLSVLAIAGTASAQTPTAQEQDEQTIWQLESAYFAHYAKGNIAALENLWHADFVGWPAQSLEPVHRAAARQSVMELLSGARIVSVTVRAQAIAVHGDVAVTHYFVDLDQEAPDGEIARSSFRVTHTWIRERGTWRVIGGMSAQ